jgi:hypothetical protein
MEEMAEDDLDIFDAEHAIFNGKVVRTERGDSRGRRYVVKGVAVDEDIPVGLVGRSTETGRFLIITIHDIVGREE